jgi:hypothetical protein
VSSVTPSFLERGGSAGFTTRIEGVTAIAPLRRKDIYEEFAGIF